MLYHMPQFREDQLGAGQFAGIYAARHAKYYRIINYTGSGPGHNSRRADLPGAEMGEK